MTRRVALATLLFWAAAAGLAAQETARSAPTGKELDALTEQVASELRCPVCRSLSVRDSQAPLAREVEGVIRERLAAGESPEEVRAYFVSKYGEWILLAPPKRGFTLLVWVLPFLALGLGGAFLVVIFRRWLEAPVDDES
ncbi:MAG: cytochrome c-type biogenesis protein CcmH [Longimicrobiales bacterium]